MEFLEVPLFDDDVFKLLVRFAINLAVVAIIVLGCYRAFQTNEKYVFTFMVLNVMVFFICFALKKLELELGLALGLFAIFGIIRYRTESIGVHEMTYLFVVVGIAVINSLSNKKTSYVELAVTNGIVVATTFWLERRHARLPPVAIGASAEPVGEAAGVGNGKPKKGGGKANAKKQTILYDNMELLSTDRREALRQDLQARTGQRYEVIEVSKIDLVQQVATLTVYENSAP